MKKILLFIISFYKRFISTSLVSLFGHSCRYQPTCSEYAYEAVEKYGVFKGSLLAIKRVLRCNPFARPSFDPVK